MNEASNTKSGLQDDHDKHVTAGGEPGAFSFRRAKLKALGSELRLLFEGKAAANHRALVIEGTGEEPHLLIGASGRIDIDPADGLYIFRQNDARPAYTLSTASEECVIDHVVTYLAASHSELAPRTLDSAIDFMVGQSLKDVERHLIARTLVYFHGDRTQAAIALGISVQQLLIKLDGLWSMQPDRTVPQ